MTRFLRYLPATLFVLFLLSSVSTAHAATLCPPGDFAGLCNVKLEGAGGSKIIGGIISILLIISIITCLIFLVLGGIKWTTSGGDQGKVAAARGQLIAAIVGLVISVSAFFLVNVVSQVLTGQSFTGGLEIPKL